MFICKRGNYNLPYLTMPFGTVRCSPDPKRLHDIVPQVAVFQCH